MWRFDKPDLSNWLSFYLFANDTSICFKSNNLKHLQTVDNKELNKVRKWLDAKKLVINIVKPSFFIFHSPQKNFELN